MAFTISMLAWSIIQYEAAYKQIGEWDYALENVKWGTDYLLKVELNSSTSFSRFSILLQYTI
jgi:endoglucanase